MRLLGPTQNNRLNEAGGLVSLFGAIILALSLISFQPTDPSWNTATPEARATNLIGQLGSYSADLLYQCFGLAAWLLPIGLVALGWKWVQSKPIEVPMLRTAGYAMLVLAACTGLTLIPWLGKLADALPLGGVAGVLMADALVGWLNPVGAALFTAICMVLSLYIVSTFSLVMLYAWFAGPIAWCYRQRDRIDDWRERRAQRSLERRKVKEQKEREKAAEKSAEKSTRRTVEPPPMPEAPPWDPDPVAGDIPIRTLQDELKARPAPAPVAASSAPEPAFATPIEADIVPPEPVQLVKKAPPRRRSSFTIPSTSMLNEVGAGETYDSAELKEIAQRIKAKFEEFNVLGSVVQINPGPVVTTFEFKPEAGIKYSKIITLNDDLCLGLQAESIFIERIPGKPTVGIEVPNSRREVISLRQILESVEFNDSPSKMTICLGKDINGRIRVASLETMPHLLIAGSTGSGKSVMLNSLIMSILYKSTPDEVRMILVDPKRVEMGIYEGIPHLLTPVITDAKQATNALRNAVVEMERRLKLLAGQGVRNIDQFNKKVRQLQDQPRSLFEEEEGLEAEELRPLPYILIVIDELADLMMLERANVEASVTRLAQMARAVGMHLVLATQRPSVDVITGLIKANFPSRISFRVATRVDSRTVLDVMGAEHLLGRGDMLYLPPGSSRLTRVHGALVTENEINRVVDDWKGQAHPDYDQSFLLPPPSEDEELNIEEGEGQQDPMYADAVRVVIEMGKASTSILQRRLRLGYGRAARILDRMQREGIIGPPDGSRPRDVLKTPDWL
ncbi:MAG: DNA translocase FtsK [Bryobacteraceae bacterium]|nr:DNA translocase FtsK [Bryobacteraceae bacterium]